MNIKDFKPGQEAYTLLEETGRNTADKIKRVIVSSIGRKYVKAAPEGSTWTTDYYSRDDEEEYLTENKDWGQPEKLFPDEQAIDDYVEKKAIYEEISKEIRYGSRSDFTLEQLRAVKRILEEKDHG